MSYRHRRQSRARVRAAGVPTRSGVAEGDCAAHGGFDADAEQVADASGIAARGRDSGLRINGEPPGAVPAGVTLDKSATNASSSSSR